MQLPLFNSGLTPSSTREPLPTDPLGQRLCQIFTHLWMAILKPNQPDAAWTTLTRYPLRPRKLWDLWQDPTQLIGVRFGHSTRYALIDLDRLSRYHPLIDPSALAALRAALETIGIVRTLLTQSSTSGGLHLWIPLPEAVPTWSLALALRQSLSAQGFAIKPGQLEIFPNPKSYGNPQTQQYTEYNAHRLPLQPDSGSYLLDPDLNPTPSQSLETFLNQWEYAAQAQDLSLLSQALSTAKAHQKQIKPQRASSRLAAWKADLELEIREGWSGPGQTNHLLKTIACYGIVFLSHSGDTLIDYIEQTAQTAPGYLQHCQHQRDLHTRATAWAKAAERYYWPVGSPGKSRSSPLHRPDAANNICPFNQQRAQHAQQRIQHAVRQLEQSQTLPSGITARRDAIAQLANCSYSTLSKYPALWHPQQYVSPHPEPDPAPPQPDPAPPTKPPEPRPEAVLHTSLYMKGVTASFDAPPAASEAPGRFPSEFSTAPPSASASPPRPLPTSLPPDLAAQPRLWGRSWQDRMQAWLASGDPILVAEAQQIQAQQRLKVKNSALDCSAHNSP